MSRKVVAILFSSKPDFEKYAFKFFILNLNKVQNQYEFIFTEKEEHVYKNDYYSVNELFQIFENKIRSQIHFDSKPEFFINIITQEIENNYFFIERKDVGFITTNTWEEYYSPPSLFEYLSHCIVASLLILDFNMSSHSDTRGCCLDYCFEKTDEKVDIVLGYICDKCKNEIIQKRGQESFDALMNILDRKWIGNLKEFGTVAYDLQKFFKINIDRQSGFNKNIWEKIKEPFYSLPKEVTGYAISALIGALVATLLK